jgi:hypothetical protein
MQKGVIKVLFAVAAVGVLAGCSAAATTAPASTSAPPAAATSAPASQPGPGDIPVAQTVREGQPFTVSFDYAAGYGSASWKLTLASVRCGSGTIFDPKVIAAGDESTGETPVAHRPHPGNKFCLVKFSDTNESHSNQNWQASQEVSVNVGMNAYQDNAVQDGTGTGTGLDAEQSYMQEAQPHSQTSDFGINPGVSGVSWAVFEVPQAAKVTSVSVEASASSAGPQVVITLAGTPQPSASPSFSGDPSPGSGTGPACTTVPGYYPGGLPGHKDSSGFCVPDKS